LDILLDATKGLANEISHTIFYDEKDDGISTFGLILCVSPQKFFRKLRNIQEINPKVNILSSCLH